MSSNQIKISARVVQVLLAGKLTPEQLKEGHADFVRLLENTLRQGRSITAARLEPPTDEDDDWIVLEFGEPDAAVSEFINPIRGN